MKAIKSAVNILSGAVSAKISAKTVHDPNYGEMYLGPEYERYAELRAYQKALGELILDVESLTISRAEALPRIAEIQKTYAAVEMGVLAGLRQALEAPREEVAGWGGVNLSAASQVVQALARLREQLSPISFGVSDLASRVPKPPRPDASPRDPGQRLGSGPCWRGE